MQFPVTRPFILPATNPKFVTQTHHIDDHIKDTDTNKNYFCYGTNTFDIQSQAQEIASTLDDPASAEYCNTSAQLNYPDGLTYLSRHIVENKKLFPLFLAQSAARYLWQAKHNEALPTRQETKLHKPPYRGLTMHTHPLENYVKYEAIPNNDGDKFSLAWNLCIASFSANLPLSDGELNAHLKQILRGITILQFINVCLKLDPHIYSKALTSLCNFLTYHFEGSIIHFSKVDYFTDHDTVNLENGMALANLISNNIHLRKIRFQSCDLIVDQMEPIGKALGDSSFIQNIALFCCGIYDIHVDLLADGLKNSLIHKELNLGSNEITFTGLLSLLKCEMITSLELPCNRIAKTDFPKIPEALKHHTSLLWLDVESQFPTKTGQNHHKFKSIDTDTKRRIDALLRRNRRFKDANKMATFALCAREKEFPVEFPGDMISLVYQLWTEQYTALNVNK